MVDHYLIFEVRKIKAKRLLDKEVKPVKTRGSSNHDKQLFLDELLAIDWNETLAPANGDPDLMASIFNSIISSLLEAHATLNPRKITGHHAPWVIAEIENLMKEHNLAKKRSEKDAPYWSDYKKSRNKVSSELRARVHEYNHNLIDETQNKQKTMWKTAFDTIGYSKLLEKISKYAWFKDYLFVRKAVVSYSNCVYDEQELYSGVP